MIFCEKVVIQISGNSDNGFMTSVGLIKAVASPQKSSKTGSFQS